MHGNVGGLDEALSLVAAIMGGLTLLSCVGYLLTRKAEAAAPEGDQSDTGVSD
jgi:hypothetical protein